MLHASRAMHVHAHWFKKQTKFMWGLLMVWAWAFTGYQAI